MTRKEITISFEEYSAVSELTERDNALCREAEKALNSSHSPYSGFRVGAALLLKSGRVVHGSNQENVAYPSGLCAERVALFTAGANYPGDTIVAMAVTAKTDQFEIAKPVTSCGGCLQVMAEYESKQEYPFDVFFYCIGGKIIKISGVRSLMPLMFDESRMKK